MILEWSKHPISHLLPCRLRKLMYRVVFPFELKLPNTTDDAEGQDAMYSLFAVVVHVGSGPHHGKTCRLRGQQAYFSGLVGFGKWRCCWQVLY